MDVVGADRLDTDLMSELVQRDVELVLRGARIGPDALVLELDVEITRREELLLSPEALKMSANIRKVYGKDGADEMAEKIILLLTRTESNAVFLKRILKK